MDKNTMIDETALHELFLCTVNDGEIYRSTIVPTINNMKKKVKNGTYSETLSLKAWEHVAEYGAKMYCKQFGGTWHKLFPVPLRKECAKKLQKYFDEDVHSED